MKLDPYFTVYTKINPMGQDPNVRAKTKKTIKHLKENTGLNLHDLEFGSGFLITPKAQQATKEKKA